jgi:hypothetical protein
MTLFASSIHKSKKYCCQSRGHFGNTKALLLPFLAHLYGLRLCHTLSIAIALLPTPYSLPPLFILLMVLVRSMRYGRTQQVGKHQAAESQS